MSACVELLQDDSIASDDNLVWEPAPEDGQYGELNSGAWWRHAHAVSKADEKGFSLTPIFIYADTSCPDFRQSSGLKPIYVACGNYRSNVTKSFAGKKCIGFWPEIKVARCRSI